MKLFWSLITAFVLAAAAYLAVGMWRAEPTPSEPDRRSPLEATAAEPPKVVPAPIEPAPAPAVEGTPPQQAPPAQDKTTPEPPPARTDVSAPSTPPQPVDSGVLEPANDVPVGEVPSDEPSEPAATPPTPAPAIAAPAPQDAPEAQAATDAPVEAPAEVKVEKRQDGALVLDGKYIVAGEGTKEKPYRLTWDLLVSVGQDYAPRDGKKNLPGRITMFDGTWVEMTGYIAFPLMVKEPNELLSMMNQWDGCCIGIPPTPYDAIEVRLAMPVTGDARYSTFGTVAGKLKVEPSLVGNWVVGLYVMDRATVTAKAYGAIGP